MQLNWVHHESTFKSTLNSNHDNNINDFPTGMLLEQHKEAVLNLLSNPKLLEEQVNLALKTLKEYVTSLQHIRAYSHPFLFLSQSDWVHYNVRIPIPSRQNVEETDVSDSSDADDAERLGERLFSLVEELDPLHANDITGEPIIKISLCAINATYVGLYFGGIIVLAVSLSAQVCCWRWTQLLSNRCSVTARCWRLLFEKRKQLWKHGNETSRP